MERFLAAGPPTLPAPHLLREAFLWSHTRRVTKTATLSLHGNTYEVDAALVGRQVEVVFDPFDLTTLHVRYQGRAMGTAVPHRIGRHVHPDARPDLAPSPAAPTGIDYLGLVATQHHARLAARINYTDLPTDPDTGQVPAPDPAEQPRTTHPPAPAQGQVPEQIPGQLDLTDLIDQGHDTPDAAGRPR